MQSLAEVESTCYGNVLAEAERRTNGKEPPRSGRCRDCSHCFHGADYVDLVGQELEDVAERYGVCDYEDGAPVIVALDCEHDERECFDCAEGM